MPAYLCATVTFLNETYHGRGDGGKPEWPPSPLRLFQAVLCAGAYRWREAFGSYASAAFKRFEQLTPPVIVAPVARPGVPYALSVPNNAMDLVADNWGRGGDASIASHRAMKTVHPFNLNHGASVHYLWSLSDDDLAWAKILTEAGDGLSSLGWGIDMVAACVRVIQESDVSACVRILQASDANALAGERWQPVRSAGKVTLRVPQPGTLAELSHRHEKFLKRIDNNRLTPVPPVSCFGLQGYSRACDPTPRPWCAFKLLETDGSRNKSFDPVRHTAKVAAMTRHAVCQAAERAGWPSQRIATCVHGHDGNGAVAKGDADLPRFMYLPVPSMETWEGNERVGRILRVLIAAPPALAGEIAWLRRALSGAELIDEDTKTPDALLSLLPGDEWTLKRYTRPSCEWATVAPLVLQGYDDGKATKSERLIRAAIVQAGIAKEIADAAEIEWRHVGFFPGLDLATRYDTAAVLKGRPRYHLRIRFPIDLPGPLAIGAGRYSGFGLLAPLA